MKLRKGTRFLGILAMLSVLFFLATTGIMQGIPPAKVTCQESFPSLPCINGSCTAESHWTEWCRIWGCDSGPGFIECYPK